MTAIIVKVHGKLFTQFAQPDESIDQNEAHCIFQTCGTTDGTGYAEMEYTDPTPEEIAAQIVWEREFQAGKRQERDARRSAATRALRIKRLEDDQREYVARAERKRGWARDAMRCGLPNPFPEAFH